MYYVVLFYHLLTNIRFPNISILIKNIQQTDYKPLMIFAVF